MLIFNSINCKHHIHYHRHEQVNIFCQNLLIKSFTTKTHTGLVYKSLGHAVNQLLFVTTFFFKLIKDKMVHIEKFFKFSRNSQNFHAH